MVDRVRVEADEALLFLGVIEPLWADDLGLRVESREDFEASLELTDDQDVEALVDRSFIDDDAAELLDNFLILILLLDAAY